MKGIKKAFLGTQVLKGVDFDLFEGEVHALVGENGAGKTTLMNILDGFVKKDEGEILLHGGKVEIATPAQARDLGISYVAQELSLIDQLTVKENLALGIEPTSGNLIERIVWKELDRRVETLTEKWGFDLDPNQRVSELSLAERQMVEIAKALFLNGNILILDEPTSALTGKETKQLFGILQTLKEEGRSIIYITHRLDEVFSIADRVSVLRDGVHVGTRTTDELSPSELFKMMVGREVEKTLYKRQVPEHKLLHVKGLTTTVLHDISFYLREGEVLGVAGLTGSGRTELLEALFGCRKVSKGKLYLDGREIKPKSPAQAIKHGIYYIPEDRRNKGLFLSLNVSRNVGASSMSQHMHFGLLSEREERKAIQEYIRKLRIITPSLEQIVAFLSGGNQQKVVLAKAFKRGFKVLLMNDPTRGIDVGAKQEIYQLIDSLARKGMGILLVSSELDELLRLSDRIMVMHRGRVTKILEREEASKRRVLRYMFGNVGNKHVNKTS